MNKIHFILCFSFAGLFASAKNFLSDSLRSIYENKTICLQMDMGSGFIYKKDGEVRLVGKFAENVSSDLSGSPDALAEASIATSNLRKGFRMGIGGAMVAGASAAAGIIVTPIAFAGVIVGIVVEMVGVKKMTKGNNHLFKAIWLYNRDVMANAFK